LYQLWVGTHAWFSVKDILVTHIRYAGIPASQLYGTDAYPNCDVSSSMFDAVLFCWLARQSN
jgi:hypothetical protein